MEMCYVGSFFPCTDTVKLNRYSYTVHCTGTVTLYRYSYTVQVQLHCTGTITVQVQLHCTCTVEYTGTGTGTGAVKISGLLLRTRKG